ncbi:MAG: class I SAM-dependent methyltransferase [Acidobacteriota bacterium]|nr:class I SAM-dependent methyltransferase [Acidobacteriota bacterium]
MAESDVHEQMRAEWNERAREDANYYVAFGRREQGDEEFFATGADVVRSLEAELKRLPADVPPHARRALEIGCGPGRLMRPMSRHFGEIHGVDVSDEMIRRAREKLHGVPNAFPHHSPDSSLAEFADASFDFVYSYAVFQHIPSRDVVFHYLCEAGRILKPGGILRAQINGLPKTVPGYTTWSGVRISGDEVAEFARHHGFLLLALDGLETQYMWTTWRKLEQPSCRVRAISNAHTGEQAVPASGRLACASFWIENLPNACDLLSLEARVDGVAGKGCYVGPPANGLSQFNVLLPPHVRTGLVPIEIRWNGRTLCPVAWMRVIPPGPSVPRVFAISDGVNLLSGSRIERGTVKVTLEEVKTPESFEARIDGLPVRVPEIFCTDPLNERYEVNFLLPEAIASGPHRLEMRLGSREFAPVPIEVV